MLTLARIAENYSWCKEFLENILQELEGLVLVSDGSCPLLTDMIKDESVAPLWESCCSTNFIEQQTAVRLILLAGSQSPLIYHQTVAQLLSRNYAENKNGLGALVRILALPLGIPDTVSIRPAIELALDELFVRSKHRRGVDDMELDLNVLTNLLTLIKLELKQQRSSSSVDRLDVCQTMVNCVDKVSCLKLIPIVFIVSFPVIFHVKHHM